MSILSICLLNCTHSVKMGSIMVLLVPCFGISWELGFEFIADHNMHQLFMADLRINLFLSVLCPKRAYWWLSYWVISMISLCALLALYIISHWMYQHSIKLWPFLSNLFSDLQFYYYICSLQKTIDRYKAYTRENVNNKSVQQDIQVKFYRHSFFNQEKAWIVSAAYMNIWWQVI
jgi:hypothetical protein